MMSPVLRADHRVSSGDLRRASFLFQDGMVLATTLRGLQAVGLLAPSLTQSDTVARLCPGVTETGFAHLRVGLRTLAQAGWVTHGPALVPGATTVDWTAEGRAVARVLHHYLALGDFVATFDDNHPAAWTRPWHSTQVEQLGELVALAEARWQLAELGSPLPDTVTAHLDGSLISPPLLWLEASGRLRGPRPLLPEGPFGELCGRLLRAIGWLGDDGSWVGVGAAASDIAAHLGLVGSYLPLFARLPELYAGVTPGGRGGSTSGVEWHVQRELNIRASTAAHGRYFHDADRVVARVFDREPVSQQPRFVLDTGCGDGSWLARIHRLVLDGTLRGRHLDDHPLTMVGADLNGLAVARARSDLAAAGIPALVLRGDVSDPDALRDDLATHGLDIRDALHVHAFVDHDRGYGGRHAQPREEGTSSGAYLTEEGHALAPGDVEADLEAHFSRWAPYVGRHGLVLLEAHCVAPEVARRHQGALHSLAFDAYHAYSRQYPVERRALIGALRGAGLRQAATGELRYPSTRPFVAVTLNHALAGDVTTAELLPGCLNRSGRRDTWRPADSVDRSDGAGLHRLLYEDGDLRHPRLWSSTATATLVARATQVLEGRLAALPHGSVLRVLDYGTGTGLAAIELLKAVRETGLEERLESRGVTLELHLADIPSSWFAQGHDLVRACAWTQCHSLTDATGAFRPLLEVTGGVQVDVVMSSMVFHLVPPAALGQLADNLATVTAPGGHLLWNSPDLGVPGPYAVLFHDPNRALRSRWTDLLRGLVSPSTPLQQDALAAARARARDGTRPLVDDRRASRRILPEAHTAQDVVDALGTRFSGSVTVQTHEITDQEVVDGLLVPSNQREYLPEVEDAWLRSALVEELMGTVVLPELRAGPAATALGLNLHWTSGDFRLDGP